MRFTVNYVVTDEPLPCGQRCMVLYDHGHITHYFNRPALHDDPDGVLAEMFAQIRAQLQSAEFEHLAG